LVLTWSPSTAEIIIDLSLIRLPVSSRSCLVALLAVPVVPSLRVTRIIVPFISTATGLLLRLLLPKLLICSSLSKHGLGLELPGGNAAARVVSGMGVSVASILLAVPILPSCKTVDWVLRGVDVENSLYYLDCLFALEVAAISVIDGEVFDLSSGQAGSLEKAEKMSLVLGMLEVHEEAPA
jgi:hypothetical protein